MDPSVSDGRDAEALAAVRRFVEVQPQRPVAIEHESTSSFARSLSVDGLLWQSTTKRGTWKVRYRNIEVD